MITGELMDETQSAQVRHKLSDAPDAVAKVLIRDPWEDTNSDTEDANRGLIRKLGQILYNYLRRLAN